MNRDPQNLASGEYWAAGYRRQPLQYRPERVWFADLFARYFPAGGTCFEVGCYPGDYLIHLGRAFGYTVHGIDQTPATAALAEHLRAHGVAVGRIHQGDFLSFTPPQRYEAVVSVGFVEHFSDFETVIQRHADLLAPGGTLLLAAPNFRRMQYVFHRLFDRENLERHVLAAMDLSRWREILAARSLEILFADYYGTFDFWMDAERPSLVSRVAGQALYRAGKAISRRVHRPTPSWSPFLVIVARRPAA
ncbi:MAG: class I SAM-dependent methyltransferase [Myxococcales bacterium]|nr:class I SAM-dependent methyltransferase [Myxococcales bacterium]